MTSLEMDALWLSCRIALLTTLICLPLSMVIASWAGRRRGRGRWVIDALLLLPMSLSPAVLGWSVLRVFGHDGPIGSPLFELFGWGLSLVPDGLVLVAGAMTLPLMIRMMRPAFESVDTGRVMTARTLGANRWDAWWHVTASQARPAIVSALALGFAAAWGESGASLMLAAALQGTDVGPTPEGTVPLSIVNALQTEPGQHIAFRLSMVSLGVALGTSMLCEWSHQRWRRRALPQGARGVAA